MGVDPVKITVTTATDGNHGRSVAWGAQLLMRSKYTSIKREQGNVKCHGHLWR